MLCRRVSVQTSRGSLPVYLNVYDLTSINGYAYWLGLGAYHSGVEVDGVEYAFGAHEQATSGIFEGVPKQHDGFIFRRSILVGWSEMNGREVRKMMEDLAEKYRGNAYNLITKNCNHFCNDACIRLTGNPIPNWVNRLARIGFYCKCIIPENINVTRVAQQDMENKACEVEKKMTKKNMKMKSQSKRLNTPTNSTSSSSDLSS